jgi:hypothetical protein
MQAPRAAPPVAAPLLSFPLVGARRVGFKKSICRVYPLRTPSRHAIRTALSQVTAGCPVFIASNMCPRASPPRGEVEGDVLACEWLEPEPTSWRNCGLGNVHGDEGCESLKVRR